MKTDTTTANGMPMSAIPLVPEELPEFPPQGFVVYIPHRWRDGSKAPTEYFSNTYIPRPGMADEMGCAYTIKREGNVDTYISCGCKLCAERWNYKRSRG